MASVILAGDIGGTKTVIASCSFDAGRLAPIKESTYESTSHASLEEILRRFIDEQPGFEAAAACFGVAGAVVDGRARVTNLPWLLEEGRLAEACGVQPVVMINDLEAAAYGVLGLDDAHRATLNPGRERAGNIAVIAAGTGLGEALLVWDGSRHTAVASEGGHASFAPRSDEQIELLRFLRSDFGDHVSTERVLSGPGLHNIYRFVRQSQPETEPNWLADRFSREDPSAVIAELAIESADPVCQRSLDLFTSIYASEAGDLALRYLALGGVYLAGGIAPKILPALQNAAFMSAFSDKGRFARMMSKIPVTVSLEPRAALLGAARHAAGQL